MVSKACDIIWIACLLLWTTGAVRTRHGATNSTNVTNVTNSTKPPEKVPLQLSFSALLSLSGGGVPNGEEVKVTADEAKLRIMIEDMTSDDMLGSAFNSQPTDRTLVDVAKNVRHEQERFFDERVCFTFTCAWKDDIYAFYSEGQLRRMKGVDAVLKKAANASSFLGMEANPGLKMEFIATGVVQPGDPAPDFKLPASSGGELSLSELLQGNEYLVVFFRPGSRFRGGDLQEVRLFGKATRALAERGATVVGIQMEPVGALAAQAKGLDLSFPLLCDYNGATAKAYGAYLELEEQGPNIDRKTFIIGKDGSIKTSFVDVGYDADKNQLVRHVADVVRILGGDPVKVKSELAPKSQSLGDFLGIANPGSAPVTPAL